MSRVRCLAVAIGFAVAVATLCAVEARAGDGRRDDDTFLFFTGTDLWRHGGFSHGGLLWSPAGVDRSGFTFKLLLGAGSYRYLSGALGDVEVTGRQAAAHVLPGWRFVRDKTIVSVFAGLDIQHHRLTPDDPGSDLRGSHTGIRGAIEFWHEPTAHTMWAADASASSVGPSYSARLAFGWRVFDAVYVGPEIAGFAGGDTYRQLRAGLHLTGLKFNFAEWTAACGWATDSDDRNGLYGRLGLLVRR